MHPPPQVPDAIAALYRAAAGSESWPEALQTLSNALGGAFALVGIVDKTANRTNSITSEPFAEGRRELYRQRYFAMNPRVRHSAQVAVGEVFFDAALGRDVELARHPYYGEFLATRGFTNFISTNLVNAPSRRVNLSVQRSRSAGHVDTAEVDALKKIAPHAVAAFELWERLQGVSAQARLIAEALEALDAGVLMLDEQGRLVFVNPTGAALLASGGPLVRAGESIAAADTSQRTRLAEAIAAARTQSGDASSSTPARMTLASADGRRFALKLRPMPEFIRLDDTHWSGVILILEPVRPLSTVDEIQRVLGLTAAEAALALSLADGNRPRDYARIHGVSINTVRTHLASLREKLEAKSQTQIVAKLLQSLR
jgi:DNA-binding CsgD family transcriptional regulator